MSKTPRQDALQPPAPPPLFGKSERLFISLCLLIPALGLVGMGIALSYANKGSYTIQCAVITPDGPVPTVNLKAHDVIVTDFGIVKSKEGIYIPTTNEVCLIKKESE